jgi:hypothetical protein
LSAEITSCDGRQQLLFVSEVFVRSVVRYPRTSAHLPEGHRRHAPFFEEVRRRFDEGIVS